MEIYPLSSKPAFKEVVALHVNITDDSRLGKFCAVGRYFLFVYNTLLIIWDSLEDAWNSWDAHRTVINVNSYL